MGWEDEEMAWRVMSIDVGTWQEKMLLVTLATEADCRGIAQVALIDLLKWTRMDKSQIKQSLRVLRVMHTLDYEGEPCESTVYHMKVGFWGTPRQDGLCEDRES
jgi:hypothetical protein